MLEKIKNKVMNLNYKKTAVRFVIISIAAILVCGTVSAVSLKKQIGEAVSYHQTCEKEHDEKEKSDSEQNQSEKNDYIAQVKSSDSQNHKSHKQNHKDDDDDDFFDEANITEPSVFSKVSLSVTAIVTAAAFLFYWLLTAAWLYKSAAKTSMNKAMWAVLGLIGNIATVIAFLITRSFLVRCPECGKYQQSGKFCRNCGKELPFICKNCGGNIRKNDDFCHNCGKNVAK